MNKYTVITTAGDFRDIYAGSRAEAARIVYRITLGRAEITAIVRG